MNLDFLKALPVWQVAFLDEGRYVWWQRFLKRGFSHCLAFAWDAEAERWLIVNPGFDGGLVRAVSREKFTGVLAALRLMGATIVRARRGEGGPMRPKLLLTCVSVITVLLALERCCALTPYALYRHLLRRGATLIPPPAAPRGAP